MIPRDVQKFQEPGVTEWVKWFGAGIGQVHSEEKKKIVYMSYEICNTLTKNNIGLPLELFNLLGTRRVSFMGRGLLETHRGQYFYYDNPYKGKLEWFLLLCLYLCRLRGRSKCSSISCVYIVAAQKKKRQPL